MIWDEWGNTVYAGGDVIYSFPGRSTRLIKDAFIPFARFWRAYLIRYIVYSLQTNQSQWSHQAITINKSSLSIEWHSLLKYFNIFRSSISIISLLLLSSKLAHWLNFRFSLHYSYDRTTTDILGDDDLLKPSLYVLYLCVSL